MYKLGTKVWCCWDGKLGRRCEGIVVATHRGHAVSIKFTPWLSESGTSVVHKFRVVKRGRKWGGRGKRLEGYVNDISNDAWYRVYSAKQMRMIGVV